MRKKNSLLKLVVVIFALVAMVGGYNAYQTLRAPSHAASAALIASAHTSAHAQTDSFIDLRSAATSWRQGPSRSDSVLLFKKSSDCFIEINRLADSYNEQPELRRYRLDPKTTEIAMTPLTLRGQEKNYNFLLHRFKVDDSGPNAVYPSQQVGFVVVPNGRIRVDGYCANPSDESALVEALVEIQLRDR